MINKHLFILLVNLFVLAYPQTINIEGKKLNIGMDKSIALDIMHEFLDQKDHDSSADNFWLQSNDKIIGTMGFKDDKLNYVTTDWDENIDYLDSIELFNTLFSVLKNTFGPDYGGDIILELKEVQDTNLEKFVINMYSKDGRSVRINRNNINLDIRQAAQKL
jgi:hypothetical protein|tara:strand:- start:576 stop:1061 length:486 start_codon:yes stop_codon:yes gene_type:complete